MSQSDPTSDACLGTLTLPPLGKNPTPHLKVLHLIVPILPPHQISIVRGKSLSLSLPTGASLSMPLAVVTELILRCKFADPSLSALIPNDSMGRAAIGSYFRLRSTDGLEGHFCSRSFAAGPRCTSPTLADLGLLFGHFGGENAASIASECGPNVERWFRTTAAFAAEMAERGGSVVTVPSVSIDRSVPVFCFPGVESNMPAKAVESIAGTKNTKEGDDKGSSKDADGKNTAVDAVKSGQLSEEQKAAVAAKRAAKKGKKKKEAAPGKNQQKKEDDFNISSLDIRVGLIKRAWEHETAEKLYCEEIDVGEEKPRTIASGLRAFYKLEDMQNRRVLVLCNLKSRNLVGFPSHGMVLCASNADHSDVQMVIPPENASVGERVTFGEYKGDPEPENRVAKKKVFEKVAPDLKTDGNGQVVWKEALCMAGGGVVVAERSMPNVNVS